MDLNIWPTLIRGDTTRIIEYTLKGKIIIRNRTSFSIPKKKLEFSKTQNFIRCSHLMIPPSHEILATARRNNQNLKIKIEYNNGKSWHETFAVLNTRVAKSYIDSKMIKYLKRRILIEPHTYVWYNGERNTLSQYFEIPLKIRGIWFIYLFYRKWIWNRNKSFVIRDEFSENFSPYYSGDREIFIIINEIKQIISRYV